MKRFFLIFAVTFSSIPIALSTEQISDILIIGEDTVYLKSFPLEHLRITQKLSAPFDYGRFSFASTACWRGYVATWQIIDEKLVLIEVRTDPSSTTDITLNILEYFDNNGYIPKTINGYVVADWYSDTLVSYDFYRCDFAYRERSIRDNLYVISGRFFTRQEGMQAKLVFENGNLIENNIIPIEAYEIGNILSLEICYPAMGLRGHRTVQVKGVIKEDDGRKVRLELLPDKKRTRRVERKIKNQINPNNFWVNPRYCKIEKRKS